MVNPKNPHVAHSGSVLVTDVRSKESSVGGKTHHVKRDKKYQKVGCQERLPSGYD
jgi:hypothetical protein